MGLFEEVIYGCLLFCQMAGSDLKPFEIKQGVRQGEILSTLQYYIVQQ